MKSISTNKKYKEKSIGHGLSMQEKFDKLSKFDVRLIKWNDKRGHRRLGLNWRGEGDYYFIVEKPTIDECLDATILFLHYEH